MKDSKAIEIQIVEDTPQNVARGALEACDFMFREGAQSARKTGGSPRVMLPDLKLPKIDGLAARQRIKADGGTKSIPHVVLTSSKEQNDVVDSYPPDVNSRIVKPVNFEPSAEAVQNLGIDGLLLNHPPQPES